MRGYPLQFVREQLGGDWMTQTMTDAFEILPGKADRLQPAFESDKAFEQYRNSLADAVRHDMERYRAARRKSEDNARHQRIH